MICLMLNIWIFTSSIVNDCLTSPSGYFVHSRCCIIMQISLDMGNSLEQQCTFYLKSRHCLKIMQDAYCTPPGGTICTDGKDSINTALGVRQCGSLKIFLMQWEVKNHFTKIGIWPHYKNRKRISAIILIDQCQYYCFWQSTCHTLCRWPPNHTGH